MRTDRRERVNNANIRLKDAADKVVLALRESEQALLRSRADNTSVVMKNLLEGFSRVIEMRDCYTADHQRRVADLCVAIARELNFGEERTKGVYFSAKLHDIGKIAVPHEILSKPRKLSLVEFELMKEHVETGRRILEELYFPWPVAEIVFQHHERMDGSGYPRGLKGYDILPEAMIIAVADVVEAMASHRPYRAALGLEAALAQIHFEIGTKLDEKIVNACLKVFADGYKI